MPLSLLQAQEMRVAPFILSMAIPILSLKTYWQAYLDSFAIRGIFA